MNPGTWVLVVAVVVALGFGGYRALTDGRFRGTHRVRDASGSQRTTPTTAQTSVPAWTHVTASLGDATLGERATLLQFSSAFCAPCRATRRVLTEVAAARPGVLHLEVDAEHHLDLVRALGVLRTPTTLVLDAAGHEVTRAAGAPRRDQVEATLAALG